MVQDTKERIIKQAIACIAQNANVGLDEIARSAGVSRATLFRHFNSRADLIVAIKLSAGERLNAIINPVMESRLPAREKLLRIVTRLIPLGASLNVSVYFNHPPKQDDPRVMASYQDHLKKARQLCMELKEEGTVDGNIPLAWLVSSLDSLVYTAWEKVESGDLAPKQAPWLVLEMYLTGHGTPETLDWFTKEKEAHQ